MEKTITVKGIEQVAKGNKNGKDWVMYRIVDQDDTEYKSFNPLNLGAPYTISYSEEARKPFTNKEGKRIEPKGVERFIKGSSFADAPPVATPLNKAPNDRLDAIERKVDTMWLTLYPKNDQPF